MFERYTDRSRRVVVLAQEEARRRNHSQITPEHVLLALIGEGEGVAAKVLSDLGVTKESIDCGPDGTEDVAGRVEFTPTTKKVLELSLREALQLGHSYIGTEHILLGLVRDGCIEGSIPTSLTELRHAVIDKLSRYEQRPPARYTPSGNERATRYGLALAAVQALHVKRKRTVDGATLKWCIECQQDWPCPTTEAIRSAGVETS